MSRLLILKIGGEVLDNPALRDSLLTDFATISGPRILVHGGGKTGTEIAQRLGVETEMVNGRRITSADMLDVALMVYGGLMNKQLVSRLQALNINALGLSGADLDMVRANKRPAGDIDYGFVGDVGKINAAQLQQLLNHDITPVLAPLSHDGAGQMLNTNADTIASETARAMAGSHEVHLAFTFGKAGVLLDVDDDSSLVRHLNPAEYERLRASGQIAGGMIPKLDNAFAALRAGVHRVYICHAAAAGHLFTDTFIGTEIYV